MLIYAVHAEKALYLSKDETRRLNISLIYFCCGQPLQGFYTILDPVKKEAYMQRNGFLIFFWIKNISLNLIWNNVLWKKLNFFCES